MTSDFHLGHKNILHYSGRPFRNVEEMNDAILTYVNDVVAAEDTLYYLGDFAFDLHGDIDKIYHYRSRINCKDIRFILGNHDKLVKKYRDELIQNHVFTSITDVYTVRTAHKKIFLSHYAHRVWDQSHHGVYHLYGHSHGTLPDDPSSLSFDCGVDTNNFYPYSFDDVKDVMSRKTWSPVDHHNSLTRG